MKADNTKPLLLKLISYSIFRVFSIFPLSEESSNFRKVLLVFFSLKNFLFRVPKGFRAPRLQTQNSGALGLRTEINRASGLPNN